jgi:tetratricopeptide (TPR) repeat protein
MNMGDYYRSIKDYNQAISYYDQAEKHANQKDLDWRFYYSRGICKERLKQWSLADKDFILSLKQSPKEYRVLNYMAYSWLERGIHYNKALQLLEEAVDISKWEHGYVVDSLGWAHYLLNNFEKAESLLELAYTKAPNEAEVYDHYGDVLWKNNKKIQAKYVWSNALKLQSLEKDRKDKIKEKILNGIN